MDILFEVLKIVAYVIAVLIVLFVVFVVTILGAGRPEAPKWFAPKFELLSRLDHEALKIETPEEKEAFIRKLDECRPKLRKDEKQNIIRRIGQKPPPPNGRPVGVKPPIRVLIEFEDPNHVGVG